MVNIGNSFNICFHKIIKIGSSHLLFQIKTFFFWEIKGKMLIFFVQ